MSLHRGRNIYLGIQVTFVLKEKGNSLDAEAPYTQMFVPEVNEQKNLPGPVTSQTGSAFYLQLVHCFAGYNLSWSPPLLLSHMYFLLTTWPCPKRPRGGHTGLWEQQGAPSGVA